MSAVTINVVTINVKGFNRTQEAYRVSVTTGGLTVYDTLSAVLLYALLGAPGDSLAALNGLVGTTWVLDQNAPVYRPPVQVIDSSVDGIQQKVYA